MGAISSTASLPVLKKYCGDSDRAVRETCEIALARIEWDNSDEGRRHHSTATDEIQYVSSLVLHEQTCVIPHTQSIILIYPFCLSRDLDVPLSLPGNSPPSTPLLPHLASLPVNQNLRTCPLLASQT